MKYIPEEHDQYKTMDGNYKIKGNKHYLTNCAFCGELCLSFNKDDGITKRYCDRNCFGKSKIGKIGELCHNFGKKHSEETRKKLSEKRKLRIISEETKKKLSESGKKKSYWRGKTIPQETRDKISKTLTGNKIPQEVIDKRVKTLKETKSKNINYSIRSNNMTPYETHKNKIGKYEEIRSNQGYLEVRCTYCGKWYMPTLNKINARMQSINGTSKGENRLYCSRECQMNCPIFRINPDHIIKRDEINAGIRQPNDLTREVQKELRWLVLERDGWRCLKCGSTIDLHCHHYIPIVYDYIESADMDNCGTYCRKCHIELHKESWCKDLVYCRRKK
jgi:hypothetical protein